MSLTQEDLQAIAELTKAVVKGELEPIRARQDALSADIATLNHEIVPKINHMYDALQGIQEKFDKLDRIEAEQEGHDHRIWALEQAVKTGA